MTTNELILEKLRKNNPFMSSISPLPWENTNPDLPQLNREVIEEIDQLMRHKRREPNTPLAGLILGSTGSGKTHMLMRILQRLRNKASLAILVTIGKTFRNPETMICDLLSEIFICLKQIHSEGRSQFDILTREFMNAYKERRCIDGLDDISKADTRVYLAKDMPRLDRNFLKALLLYINTEDEAVKLNILEWLEHGLDDEDSARLGLPEKNIDMMSDAKRESEAEKTLISLGLILGYAKIPMIICFDQIENIRDRELLESWGNLISLLMNELPGILPLCFLRPETWENTFMPALDASVVRRIVDNTMTMRNCTSELARQLIHDRIAHVFTEDTEKIYQWLIAKMENAIRKQDYSPAKIIKTASSIITNRETGSDEDEILKAVSEAYNEEYKRVQTSLTAWPPNTDNLTLALDVWLNAHDEFESVKGRGKYIKIMGDYNGKRFAFVVCARRHNAAALAAFKRGCEFLKEYPEGECFYITEDKTNKSTWNKVKEQRSIFERSGGHVIMLNKDTRINWYALTALINRTDNGDVNVYLLSGSLTASRDDIKTFVKSINLIPEIFTENSKKAQQKVNAVHEAGREEKREEERIKEPESRPVIEPDVLNENLKSILNSSPMKMIAAERAIEALSRRKITVTRDELVLFLKNNAGNFKTFGSRSDGDLLIMLVKQN